MASPLITTCARVVKWSRAKAGLRVTEGSEAGKEVKKRKEKKSSLYLVIKHLQCSHVA